MKRVKSNETIEQTIRNCDQGIIENSNRVEVSRFLENENHQKNVSIIDCQDLIQMCNKKEVSVISENISNISKREMIKEESNSFLDNRNINNQLSRSLMLNNSNADKKNNSFNSNYSQLSSQYNNANNLMIKANSNISNKSVLCNYGNSPNNYNQCQQNISNLSNLSHQIFTTTNKKRSNQSPKNQKRFSTNGFYNIQIEKNQNQKQENVQTRLNNLSPMQLNESEINQIIDNHENYSQILQISVNPLNTFENTGREFPIGQQLCQMPQLSTQKQTSNNKNHHLNDSNKNNPLMLKEQNGQITSRYPNKENNQKKNLISNRLNLFFLKNTMKGRMRLLNSRIREFIGDKSDNYFYNENPNFQSRTIINIFWQKKIFFKIKNLAGYINKYIPIFHPNSKNLIIIESTMSFFNGIFLFMLSILFFFNVPQSTQLKQFGSSKSSSSSILHFIKITPFNFNKKENLSSIIAYLLLVSLFASLALSFFFKYFITSTMIENFSALSFLIARDWKQILFPQICKLILYFFLFIHFLACGWNLLVRKELSSDQIHTWSLSREKIETEWPRNYVQAFFWSLTALFTNDFLLPSSQAEMIFSCCGILINLIAIAIFLEEIYYVLRKKRDSRSQFDSDFNTLNSYLQRKSVDLYSSQKANLSLREYYQRISKESLLKGKDVLEKINFEIKEEVLISSHLKFLENSFLKKLFSDQCLKRICSLVEEISLQSKQNISYLFKKEQDDEQFLYFVADGSVKLAYNFNQEKIKQAPSELLSRNSKLSKDIALSFTSASFSKQSSSKSTINENLENQQEQKKQQQQQQQLQQQPIISLENNIQAQLIEKGGCFGVREFFTGEEGQINQAQSQEFSTLLRISRRGVLNIIKQDNKDFEIFRQVCDKLSVERDKDLGDIELSCRICKRNDHEEKDCFLVHFNKKNDFIIFRHIKQAHQKRFNFIRKSEKDRIPSRWLLVQCKQQLDLNLLSDNYSVGHECKEDQEFIEKSVIQDTPKVQASQSSLYSQPEFVRMEDFINEKKRDSIIKQDLVHQTKDWLQIKERDKLAYLSPIQQNKFNNIPLNSEDYLYSPSNSEKNPRNQQIIDEGPWREGSLPAEYQSFEAKRERKSSRGGLKRKSSSLKVGTNELLSLLERPISFNPLNLSSQISQSQMQLAKEFVLKQQNEKSLASIPHQQTESIYLPLNSLFVKKNKLKSTLNKQKLIEYEFYNTRNQLSSLFELDKLMDYKYYFRKGNHKIVIFVANKRIKRVQKK